MDDVVRGRLKVLFVSPERLTSSSFRRLFIPRWNPETRVKERHFPTVSLLCVDEAHCMSQWAHNFRPAYLRMRTMMELIQPESVLAITATAGPRVVEDICRTLNITAGTTDSSVAGALQSDDSGGVRVMKSDRDNIDVSSLILSNQEERLSKVNKTIQRDGRRYEFHLLTLFSSLVCVLCTADKIIDENKRERKRESRCREWRRRRLPCGWKRDCIRLAPA
jgi:superfamily II DNA helicase RecQ